MKSFNINLMTHITHEWKGTLEEVENMDFKMAVYSHTHDKEQFGTKSDVTQIRQYIEDLQAAIAAEFKRGTPFSKVTSTVKLPKHEHWAMYNEWLPLNARRLMLDMHMGPFPWRSDQAYEMME